MQYITLDSTQYDQPDNLRRNCKYSIVVFASDGQEDEREEHCC